jgi:hypothetical protein
MISSVHPHCRAMRPCDSRVQVCKGSFTRKASLCAPRLSHSFAAPFFIQPENKKVTQYQIGIGLPTMTTDTCGYSTKELARQLKMRQFGLNMAGKIPVWEQVSKP